jgi:hypothetical protein
MESGGENIYPGPTNLRINTAIQIIAISLEILELQLFPQML